MIGFSGYNKGVNLGGWLSQCEHTDEHHSTFISKSDIKRISEWGLDHIRLPIDYQLVRDSDGKDIEKGYSYINACLEWCKEFGLNMILDLHKTAGYSFDKDENDFFTSEVLQDKFVALWVELAKRYGNLSDRLTFELLNEVVNDSDAQKWNEIIARTIPEIRKYAPVTKIIVGGVRNNAISCLGMLDKPYDENVVYTFHFYEPLIFTHQSAYWIKTMGADFHTEYPKKSSCYIEQTEKHLSSNQADCYRNSNAEIIDADFFRNSFKEAVKIAKEREVSLYCGEYGVIDLASTESTLNWYKDINSAFEEYGISRAAWTYKGKDFGLIDEHYSDIYDSLIKLL